MSAVLRTLRYGKHPWQFSLNDRLHSFFNLKVKQTKTPKINWLTLSVRTCKTNWLTLSVRTCKTNWLTLSVRTCKTHE